MIKIKFNKDYIRELEDECKLKDTYKEIDILQMQNDIKKMKEKIKACDNILDIQLEMKTKFDPDEGWNTTSKIMDIKINCKNNFYIKIHFNLDIHGYDDTKEYYHNIDIYDGNFLKLNKDYYKEDGKFYNGKKLEKEVNSLNNFQNNLEKYCKDNNINFENLSEETLTKLMKDNLENSKRLKKEIIDNNNNTFWTYLLNIIFEKIKDEEDYWKLFDTIYV